jgi:hypothetical protein
MIIMVASGASFVILVGLNKKREDGLVKDRLPPR